jgi:hypothetical protein
MLLAILQLFKSVSAESGISVRNSISTEFRFRQCTEISAFGRKSNSSFGRSLEGSDPCAITASETAEGGAVSIFPLLHCRRWCNNLLLVLQSVAGGRAGPSHADYRGKCNEGGKKGL